MACSTAGERLRGCCKAMPLAAASAEKPWGRGPVHSSRKGFSKAVELSSSLHHQSKVNSCTMLMSQPLESVEARHNLSGIG